MYLQIYTLWTGKWTGGYSSIMAHVGELSWLIFPSNYRYHYQKPWFIVRISKVGKFDAGYELSENGGL